MMSSSTRAWVDHRSPRLPRASYPHASGPTALAWRGRPRLGTGGGTAVSSFSGRRQVDRLAVES